MKEGIVFNLQNYGIHDGPGIRTTVFLKGCPLSCWWCHNPESQGYRQEITFNKDKCIGCGDCLSLCESKEIGQLREGLLHSITECSLCEGCIDVCPTEAIELVGKRMGVSEVMREIEKDGIFYEQSGGGVTFSGGEPLTQIEFLTELLTACRSRGYHTAIDTTGYAGWDSIAQILDMTDLFLYDLKLMDNKKHIKYTGVSNELILNNLRRLAEHGANIWLRVPVIPGVNDDKENIECMGKFLSSINIKEVFLLPYHRIAMDKYKRLGKEYKLGDLKPPSDKDLNQISEGLRALGLHVKIGG